MWRRARELAVFPDPRSADPETGLVAIGGDLHPTRLLSAYSQGIFPWYSEDPILWFSPDPRMILHFEGLRVNRSLRKNLARRRYEVRLDTAFDQVIRACAEVNRPDQDGTWITSDMIEGYEALHQLGYAHSVEAWAEGELVGGMYGVSIGAAFFGESMFSRRSDASKIALVHLCRQLQAWGFHFLDCQVHTDHLDRLGAFLCSRDEFLLGLRTALEAPTRLGKWSFEGDFASQPVDPQD